MFSWELHLELQATPQKKGSFAECWEQEGVRIVCDGGLLRVPQPPGAALQEVSQESLRLSERVGK